MVSSLAKKKQRNVSQEEETKQTDLAERVPVIKNGCWICESWVEMKFEWIDGKS